MTNGILGFAIVFGFLQVYTALAAIDFGAGVLYLWSHLRRDQEMGDAVIRYMSPVWETTGVFLICFVVGLVGFFPGTVVLYSSTLLVPATIAVALLVVRGVAFTHAHHEHRPGPVTVVAFGLSSLLIPVFLGPFFTITEVGPALQAWTHPMSAAIALVGITYMWSLSSSFLAMWVERQGRPAVADRFARMATWGAVATLPATGALLAALSQAARYHYEPLAQMWPLGIVIGALAVSAALLVRRGGARRIAAFVSAMAGFIAFFAAYGFSRLPYLVYPDVTVESALTAPAMFEALVATLVAGAVLVLPGLVALAYFTLRGERTT